ncbi:hypothetical protein GH714_005318 [Hevea brasiliensis]|uniref:Rieske domain-containing protein n=1 Tax=Hevea brasiliensis TaxID=3981 RepID=A0A6A6LVF3_HEVBR|nr:hypothetical protein GH714_005318 [Hevea brasiliensis]
METIRTSSIPSFHVPASLDRTQFTKPKFLNSQFNTLPTSSFSRIQTNISKFKLFTTTSSPSSVSTESIQPPEPEFEAASHGEKFDWYSQWYPVMPVCDLDKRVPHAKKVMGLDVVVWWDRNESAWKVFDDTCPHRLAPLSEGRIDQWGGCSVFTMVGASMALETASSSPKHHQMVLLYDVLVENLMDPAHVPYAHYGIMRTRKPQVKVDREGGRPIDLSVKKLDRDGFTGKMDWGSSKFIAPCIFYAYTEPVADQGNGTVSSPHTKKQLSTHRRMALIFICIPVSPGNSRLIWVFPRNFGVWIDKIVPRWVFHVGQNLILDSDLYLLHVEERKIMDVGPANWQKACFVPTKSDALVVGFRRWLNKYAGGQVDWRGKYSGALPPTPPREQLMDRYWSHVVNCSSCRVAYKGLNALEVVLQVVSIVSIGIVAATKQTGMSAVARTTLVLMAGYVLVSPETDFDIDFNSRVPYANRMGLIADEIFKVAEENCDGNYQTPKNNACETITVTINELLGNINTAHILEPACRYSIIPSGDTNLHSSSDAPPMPWRRKFNHEVANVWVNLEGVKKALQVQEIIKCILSNKITIIIIFDD